MTMLYFLHEAQFFAVLILFHSFWKIHFSGGKGLVDVAEQFSAAS